jgi:GntR family transcriptional regulator/MocR family aminotransferase
VTAMSSYRSNGAPDPAQLVLGLGTLPERAVRSGIQRIADLLTGA